MHRLAVLVVTAVATVLALYLSTIYGLLFLAADLVLVIMFPQLTAALFIPLTNTYGAFCGYFIGLLLRFGAGESLSNLPAFIKYPLYSPDNGQLFPFRTFAMCCSLLTIVVVSIIAKLLFTRHWLPQKMDICHCFPTSLGVESANDLVYTSGTDKSMKNVEKPASPTGDNVRTSGKLDMEYSASTQL